jgi:hypothetical protein
MVFGLTMGLLLLPACGGTGLGTSKDAAPKGADASPDVQSMDTSPATPEDLAPGLPDLAKLPDLAPGLPDLAKLADLAPGDATSDPMPAPDLPDLRDVPSDPRDLIDLPDVLSRDSNLIDLGKRDVTPPADLPADLPPVTDLRMNPDKPPAYETNPAPDELPPKTDGYASLDDRGASDYCTSTGGTVDTQSCCSSVSDFRDTCTTAVGACGCSPSNSITVSICVCPTPTCFMPGYGCVGPGSTCTVGMDQTCNDNPVISSTHGRCVQNGRCVCGSFGMSATSGKCL